MSGGHWNYQSWKIEDWAEHVPVLMAAIAESERICDRVVCCDMGEDVGGPLLLKVWTEAFDKVFGL